MTIILVTLENIFDKEISSDFEVKIKHILHTSLFLISQTNTQTCMTFPTETAVVAGARVGIVKHQSLEGERSDFYRLALKLYPMLSQRVTMRPPLGLFHLSFDIITSQNINRASDILQMQSQIVFPTLPARKEIVQRGQLLWF